MMILNLSLAICSLTIWLMSSHPPKVECTKALQGQVSTREGVPWKCDDGDWKEQP